jgi:hypothetical protein
MLEVRLRPAFRYVHEPLSAYEDVLPPLGNETVSSQLRSRILHSRGGTFLITGFRGVGKSTMVLRALDRLVSDSTPGDVVLPVTLSVARSTTTERLLFAVVRRVFEALADSGAFDRLSPETRHALLVAYMRTSLSFKETQSEARERTAGLDASGAKAGLPGAHVVVPRLSMSAKRSQALAREAAFLAYSETDAEYDLMRILSLVGREFLSPSASRSWRVRLPWRHSSNLGNHGQVRLVIVLDEVDKLTADDAGLKAVEDLLGGVKNVLTASGTHFLIVAGPDLHDHAVRDAARGNGLYESVFGWRLYVPCLWNAPETLVKGAVRLRAPESSKEGQAAIKQLHALIGYLRFKARGVPRRLLQEFNSFVFFENGVPILRISDADRGRVDFYAWIDGIMRGYFTRAGQNRVFPVLIDEDRWRLGGYYVADWVLRSEGRPFSAADILRGGEDADFDPLLRISHRGVMPLLDHLANHGVLEVIRRFDARGTIFDDVAESSATVYQLAERVRHFLFGLAIRHETERAAQDISIVPAAPRTDADSADTGGSGPGLSGARSSSPIRVLADRYELSTLLGQGGMGSVFAGQDRLTGQPVAIKMLRSSMAGDAQALLRVRREVEFSRRLSHPQLVRTLDVVDGPDGSPALVMELLDGPTLSHRIQEAGPIQAYDAVGVGIPLAEALHYLADQGIARIDLKPSNIIIQPSRGPVIIDLGVARRLEVADGITHSGYLVGTPMYMAPELLRGESPDRRADIYSLGLVLYYCLVGRNPWEHLGDLHAISFAIASQPVDVSGLPISQEFRQVIARATDHDRINRFESGAEMRAALLVTPEWREREGAAVVREPVPEGQGSVE